LPAETPDCIDKKEGVAHAEDVEAVSLPLDKLEVTKETELLVKPQPDANPEGAVILGIEQATRNETSGDDLGKTPTSPSRRYSASSHGSTSPVSARERARAFTTETGKRPSSNSAQSSEPPEQETPEAEAMRLVRELIEMKEWGEAEMVIMELLDELSFDDQVRVWADFESAQIGQEVLDHSAIFLEARQRLPGQDPVSDMVVTRRSSRGGTKTDPAQEGFPGWSALNPVKLDYYSLLPNSPKGFFDGIEQQARMLYRVADDKLQIKVLSEFPSKHPTLSKSFVLAFLSMWAEVDKWDTWNPMYSDPPKALTKPTLDFMTWEEKSTIRLVMSQQGVSEMHRLFTPDGMIVQRIQAVIDPQDERNKNMKLSKGYSRKKQKDSSYTIAVLGADKTVVVVHYEVALLGKHPPNMALHAVFSMLMPTIIRKMFKVGADIFSNPLYAERHAADAVGLYARIGRSERDACDREARTGHKFHSSKKGCRPHSDIFSAGDLVQRVEKLRKGRQISGDTS